MAAARRLNRRLVRQWLAAAGLFLGGAVAAEELATVETLDLARYLGQWHQIALLPNRFQAVCVADTRATYSSRTDGLISVVNVCRDADGEVRRVEGVARRNRDFDDPARLEVRFAPAWLSFLPFVWGDYWVFALEPDYSAAAVGSPNRNYLWILARAETLPRTTYERLVRVARAQGFAVENLELEHPRAVR